MTERKRSAVKSIPAEPSAADRLNHKGSGALDVDGAALRTTGLHGWFGLLIRVCVYFTLALCAELLLNAFESLITADD